MSFFEKGLKKKFILHDELKFYFEEEDKYFSSIDHNKIDLIKMDIEGAALPIVIDLCDSKNNFGILIAELELMSNSIDDFEKNINKLIHIIEKNFYQIYRMPKEKDNFTSIEVIILNSVEF